MVSWKSSSLFVSLFIILVLAQFSFSMKAYVGSCAEGTGATSFGKEFDETALTEDGKPLYVMTQSNPVRYYEDDCDPTKGETADTAWSALKGFYCVCKVETAKYESCANVNDNYVGDDAGHPNLMSVPQYFVDNGLSPDGTESGKKYIKPAGSTAYCYDDCLENSKCELVKDGFNWNAKCQCVEDKVDVRVCGSRNVWKNLVSYVLEKDGSTKQYFTKIGEGEGSYYCDITSGCDTKEICKTDECECICNPQPTRLITDAAPVTKVNCEANNGIWNENTCACICPKGLKDSLQKGKRLDGNCLSVCDDLSLCVFDGTKDLNLDTCKCECYSYLKTECDVQGGDFDDVTCGCDVPVEGETKNCWDTRLDKPASSLGSFALDVSKIPFAGDFLSGFVVFAGDALSPIPQEAAQSCQAGDIPSGFRCNYVECALEPVTETAQKEAQEEVAMKKGQEAAKGKPGAEKPAAAQEGDTQCKNLHTMQIFKNGKWKDLRCGAGCRDGGCAPQYESPPPPPSKQNVPCTSGGEFDSATMICVDDCPEGETCRTDTCECEMDLFHFPWPCSKDGFPDDTYVSDECEDDCPLGTKCNSIECKCKPDAVLLPSLEITITSAATGPFDAVVDVSASRSVDSYTVTVDGNSLTKIDSHFEFHNSWGIPVGKQFTVCANEGEKETCKTAYIGG